MDWTWEKDTTWEGGDWGKDTVGGEKAPNRTPFFPNGHEAFDLVSAYFHSGKYEKDYIDNLTKYVMLPKSEILKMIDKLYSNIDHLNKELDELKEYVKKLPEKGFYKVVQQEF